MELRESFPCNIEVGHLSWDDEEGNYVKEAFNEDEKEESGNGNLKEKGQTGPGKAAISEIKEKGGKGNAEGGNMQGKKATVDAGEAAAAAGKQGKGDG